jgi:hypothetical protein
MNYSTFSSDFEEFNFLSYGYQEAEGYRSGYGSGFEYLVGFEDGGGYGCGYGYSDGYGFGDLQISDDIYQGLELPYELQKPIYIF